MPAGPGGTETRATHAPKSVSARTVPGISGRPCLRTAQPAASRSAAPSATAAPTAASVQSNPCGVSTGDASGAGRASRPASASDVTARSPRRWGSKPPSTSRAIGAASRRHKSAACVGSTHGSGPDVHTTPRPGAGGRCLRRRLRPVSLARRFRQVRPGQERSERCSRHRRSGPGGATRCSPTPRALLRPSPEPRRSRRPQSRAQLVVQAFGWRASSFPPCSGPQRAIAAPTLRSPRPHRNAETPGL